MFDNSLPDNIPDGNQNCCINPYTGKKMPKNMADQLYYNQSMAALENSWVQSNSNLAFWHQVELNNQKKAHDEEIQRIKLERSREEAEYKRQLEEYKAEMAIKRMEAIEELKMNRACASQGLFEDINGFLCLETVFPNGKKLISEPIMNVSCVQMICLINMCDMYDKVALLSWKDCSEPVVLNDITSKALNNVLTNWGLNLRVGRDRKKIIIEILLSYLMEHANIKKAVPKVGWNLISGEWFFESDPEKTLDYYKRRKNKKQ